MKRVKFSELSYECLENRNLLAWGAPAVSESSSWVLDAQFNDGEGGEILVTNTHDSGPGSLREAIQFANALPTLQYIVFEIPAGSTIELASSLPPITEVVIVDGTDHPDWDGGPVISISGSESGTHLNGLEIQADYTVVQGLSITGFQGHGIQVRGADHVQIRENRIGVGLNGESHGNLKRGIQLTQSTQVEIVDNVIGGNMLDGVFADAASGETSLRSNLIGLSVDGLEIIGNGSAGVQLRSSYNQVVDNLISGNGWAGLAFNDRSSGNNLISGNWIGLDVQENPLPNESYGIYGLSSNDLYAENIVGGNNHQGILLRSANGTTMERNRVGLNTRDEAVPNQLGGVRIVASKDLVFTNNIVSGNNGIGLFVGGNSSQNITIRDNLLGTDSSGHSPLANRSYGLHVHSARQNLIFQNTISGNGIGGVFTVGGDLGNEYFANRIGVSSDGGSRLNNQYFGMWIASNGNQVGRTDSPNIISDRLRPIALAASADNWVEGNVVGTNLDETKDFGGKFGVLLVAGAAQNRIQFNTFDHLEVAIRNPNGGHGNYYFDNRMLWRVRMGVDNGVAGYNPNDAQDKDQGPNRLLNYPENLVILQGGTDGKVRFTLDVIPGNANFPINIFAYRTSSDRVGFELMGSQSIFFGPSEHTINLDIRRGDRITLLAIDSDLNSSEFSQTVVYEGN